MEKLKQFPAAQKRLVCILLALICMLGLLPSTAFAAGPNTIVMEDCTHNGVYYASDGTTIKNARRPVLHPGAAQGP